MKNNNLITIQQFADKCDVSRATVYNWIEKKIVKPTRTTAGWAIDILKNPVREAGRGGRPRVDSVI